MMRPVWNPLPDTVVPVGPVGNAPYRVPGNVTASAYDRPERSCPPACSRSSSALPGAS